MVGTAHLLRVSIHVRLALIKANAPRRYHSRNDKHSMPPRRELDPSEPLITLYIAPGDEIIPFIGFYELIGVKG